MDWDLQTLPQAFFYKATHFSDATSQLSIFYSGIIKHFKMSYLWDYLFFLKYRTWKICLLFSRLNGFTEWVGRAIGRRANCCPCFLSWMNKQKGYLCKYLESSDLFLKQKKCLGFFHEVLLPIDLLSPEGELEIC